MCEIHVICKLFFLSGNTVHFRLLKLNFIGLGRHLCVVYVSVSLFVCCLAVIVVLLVLLLFVAVVVFVLDVDFVLGNVF